MNTETSKSETCLSTMPREELEAELRKLWGYLSSVVYQAGGTIILGKEDWQPGAGLGILPEFGPDGKTDKVFLTTIRKKEKK